MRVAEPDPAEFGGWANQYNESLNIADIQPDGRPVAMYLGRGGRPGRPADSFEFLVFDLDASRGSTEQIHRDMRLLGVHLEEVGIWPVPVASGPGLGRHLLARCKEPIPAALARRIVDAAAAVCPTLDTKPMTNPATGCLRPPGSPHRHGGHARLLSHSFDEAISILAAGAPLRAFEDLADELATLAAQSRKHHPGGPPGAKQRRQASDPGGPPPSIAGKGEIIRPIITGPQDYHRLDVPKRALTDTTRAALGRVLAPEDNHDHHAHAVLLGLALAGWSHADAAVLIAAPTESPGLEWFRTARATGGLRVVLDEATATRRLDRQWNLAVQNAARLPRVHTEEADPTPEVTTAVADLLTRIEAAGPARWARQSGPADKAVLHAIALIMLKAASTEVALDVRRLALLTGYSRQTANVAIRDRLILDGWLTELEPPDPHHSQARVLTLAASHTCTGHRNHVCAVHAGSDTSTNAAPPPLRSSFVAQLNRRLAELSSDVWATVGRHVACTYSFLELRPVILSELSETTGYTTVTIRRHLAVLTGLGLIESCDSGWTRSSRTLAETSPILPSHGRGIERAVMYAVERAVHEWWEAELAWLRLPREDKRRRGRRAPADQTVLPAAASTARAYPRDEAGKPDHARAWAIEAERLDVAETAVRAWAVLAAGLPLDLQELLHGRVATRSGSFPYPTTASA